MREIFHISHGCEEAYVNFEESASGEDFWVLRPYHDDQQIFLVFVVQSVEVTVAYLCSKTGTL